MDFYYYIFPYTFICALQVLEMNTVKVQQMFTLSWTGTCSGRLSIRSIHCSVAWLYSLKTLEVIKVDG